MKKRIHINQHIIRQNKKLPAGKRKPPITIKCSTGNFKAWEVDFSGSNKLIYSPEKPMPCGAKVWIETRNPLSFLGDVKETPWRTIV